MGFGLLFIGYLLAFAFSVANVYMFFDVVGSLIMAYALMKLSPHAKFFKAAAALAAGLAALGVALFIIGLAAPDAEALLDVMSYVKAAAVLAFHVLLMLGIKDIAGYTELPAIGRKALRNLIIGCIYIALSVVIPFTGDGAQYFYLPVLLYGYVWIIMNAALIYSCYMRICLEGDEDMEPKPSKYKIVNDIREKLDKAEDSAFIKKKKEEERVKDAAQKRKKHK
jgi:hypothetical protein